MIYEIWAEGYRATGDVGYATLMGKVEASSFREACSNLLSADLYYDRERGTYWGCRLFDNEADARRMFG